MFFRISIILVCLFMYTHCEATEGGVTDVDWTKTKIWGPGLKSAFNVPSRYFFVQLKQADGEK